jgi:hypothetical protein
MHRRSAIAINIAMLCLAICVSLGMAQEQTSATPPANQQNLLRIAKEVRKQILTLPQYEVAAAGNAFRSVQRS